MSDLRLTLAVGDYDQTRDLALGRVRPTGIDLTVLNFNVEEIFFRFYDRLEWEISEMSMGMYTSAFSRGDNRMIAIPVFPSRVFRHSAIYVRSDGSVKRPEDLAGKTIGMPQWSQTASIYVKGYISSTVGIPLSKIKWIQAGLNDAGRDEHAQLKLPAGVDLRSVPDRTLSDMLLSGEIDAISSARPPRPFIEGDKRMQRLFPDYRTAEEAFFRQTGIFPIMHTIVIRRDAYEANRWIARNLMLAFEEARDRSVARMLDLTASHVPVPWGMDFARQAGSELVFKDKSPWPYGIEANRTTIDAFLQYTFEQGTCHRLLRAEEIFAEEALAQMKV
ncbi:MAG: 4,5-dihydroxyphthalate decarboxylase [Betaproteobacteria bacterium]|nr:4,5-dihydroxyphthalate decarboxylase [Betaproteobacteria bacterium]